MELKDLQSDLEALRELYGFLQCGGDVASSVVLGERSKLFLKNLLDGATKRVLETHKKIIAAAECGVSGISCSSESEKCRALSEFKPCASPKMLKGRNSMKESNHHALCSPKDEDAPNKLTTHQLISQQSRLSFSLDKPENRKKHSEFNKQSSMKQQSTARILSKDSKKQHHQASDDERKLLERNENNMKVERRNETIRQSSTCGFQGTPTAVSSVVGSSRSLASGDNLANQDKKEGEAVNDFSKDVDNVFEHIESHISALRLCSKLANATKGAVPHGLANMPTSIFSPVVNVKEQLVKKSELSQAFEPFSDRDELLLSGLESQRIGKKDDSNGSHQVLDQSKNDLLEDMTSQRRRIQHKEMGQTWKHIVKSNSRLNKKIGNGNVIGMAEAGGDKQSQTTSCYVHGLRVPIKQDYITKRPPTPLKMPYAIPMSSGGKVTTPTIAKLWHSIASQSEGSKVSVRPITDKKSLTHQILLEQEKSRTGNLQNKILVHQQESEESTTAGTGSNDSEAYSLPSEDSAASISRRFARGVYDESRSSTSSDYSNVGESGRLYPTRTDKPNFEPEKAEGQRFGRLRRFKNKLGLIFRRHSHHHHHGYERADCGDHSRGIHTKSTWMPLHNLLHHRNRHEVDDKLRKARVSNEAVKHQVGHFHALVEGLMQHVRHPKKSKPSKGGMGWVGNEQHGHRNRKVKQLHWWQMFMRHGGVKLPNRRRVKMGFMSKKQQLKVPKLR